MYWCDNTSCVEGLLPSSYEHSSSEFSAFLPPLKSYILQFPILSMPTCYHYLKVVTINLTTGNGKGMCTL